MIIPFIEDSFAFKLKQEMQAIQKGKIKDIYGWTSKVPTRHSS